jgi:ASC-1-like (ASCH) protein
MKTHHIIFREQDKNSFDRISRGEKIYETRAGSNEYLEVSTGDELIITCGTDTITKTVAEALHFASGEELLQKISVEEIMPKGTTNEQIIESWNSFPSYPERIQEFGIIAWKLK